MFRIIAACALGLAAVTTLPASPALADKSWRSNLDDAEPIPSSWAATGRFAQVTLAGSDEVVVTRGDRWQIRASGSPAVLAELRFEVEDGELLIGRRWRRTQVEGRARIEVIAPDVDAVTLAGSGTMRVDGMDSDEVDVTVAGSGTIDIARVSANRMSATIAGSGDLEVAGRADSGRITVAGSGDIDGRQLQLGRASVSIAGSGDARFRADGRVSASIVGSGNALVTGTNDCTQSRMGSGRLTCTR
ncbi:DUF2807 domain-containing protein [Qipengyuania sp. SS22]|uniref:head GIN domain-containing protein n=1 Tax=Qipengyuania sp. SS22 TaxID=2979461 RepID=UPI0021E60446|nr:head GIN domain-containing protein [Qipengyuania sp. SS22]UYH54532.1 DUF2807 domain-containing protein [Qipengyuania sp. SS22]